MMRWVYHRRSTMKNDSSGTLLFLERLIERVGAFIHGIYVKLINESYFPFHRQPQEAR